MSKTHVIIDEGSRNPVGLAIEFVTVDCNNDLSTFKAKCNPSWGWDDAKKEEAFNAVQTELAKPAPEKPTSPAPPKQK